MGQSLPHDAAIENGFATTKEDGRKLVVECFEDWLYKGDLSYWWFENSREQHEWIRRTLTTCTTGILCAGVLLMSPSCGRPYARSGKQMVKMRDTVTPPRMRVAPYAHQRGLA